MDRIKHELERMEWHLTRRTDNASGRIKEWKEMKLEGRIGWIWISEKNEEMQNSNSKEYGEFNCTSRREKKIYLNSATKNLEELLKNELNHEEPPWRTPVTKGWWDRMKDERIRWALRWFRCWFRRNGWGNWTPEKKRWKTIGTRIYSSRTNSEEKGLLNWMK